HRAIDLWQDAGDKVADGEDSEDGGPRAMTEAMIPIGQRVAFVWRTRALEHDQDIVQRWKGASQRMEGVLKRARERGALARDVPDWWLVSAFTALVYVGAESVHLG